MSAIIEPWSMLQGRMRQFWEVGRPGVIQIKTRGSALVNRLVLSYGVMWRLRFTGKILVTLAISPLVGSFTTSVAINALGSRNASGRISREQTSERIVAVWGKRPEVVARSPIQIVNDKGRYRQHRAQSRLRKPSNRIACH